MERDKFNHANSAESKTMAKVQLLRELASASKDDDIRNELVLYAAKLLIGEDFAFDEEKFLTPFLRNRLDKNRQYLFDNPHELKKYLLTEKTMSVEELLARISLESKFFQMVMDEFQREEFSYLENPLED